MNTEIKHRPILFSGEMVRAILAGRKTQTRRVVKGDYSDFCFQSLVHHAWGIFTFVQNGNYNTKDEDVIELHCPYGKPGDVLWVRETHYKWGEWLKNGVTKNGKQRWKFEATVNDVEYDDTIDERGIIIQRNSFRKKGWYKRMARFMSKKDVRLFLKIKSVRVERLQDINEADAVAEGISSHHINKNGWTHYFDPGMFYDKKKVYGKWPASVISFFTLWAKIHPGSWDANPWVWVVEFERCDKPENF